MVRSAFLAAVLAAIIIAAPAAARVSGAPTAAAIAHWKKVAFAPRNLSLWLRGYFSLPVHMASCHLDAKGGIATYDCNIVDVGGGVLGFALLARAGACRYVYLVGAADGRHKVNHSFTLCG